MRYLIFLSSICLFSTAMAIQGETTSYQSIHRVSEKCVALNPIPGGDYSKKDVSKESEYCSLDFVESPVALCPKTWSTSPATMIYDLTKSKFDSEAYESSKYCGQKSKGPGVKTFAKFKQTMNANGTSGTFSKSSLLYYHFSRYFDTKTKVPVSVYREMDRKAHRTRVTVKGHSLSKSKMNKAGWSHLKNAEATPSSYSPTSDLFTADNEKIYGVLLKGDGERYGTEFNGTRASGWGVGQNKDFQKTPGYLALRSPKPLLEAITRGIDQSRRDRKMRADIVDVADLQMVYWMRELTEITLMDYIFSQQDRVGNIDYEWYWFWVENGKVKDKKEKRDAYEELPRKRINEIPIPEEIAAYNPVLIQRTNLNDNDAGGRVAYANFAKKTDMLENLHHYSAKLFVKLMELNQDLQNQGPIYQWLSNDLALTDRRIRQVVRNTQLASDIIKAQCETLQFDLDDVDDFLNEGPRMERVDCSNY